MKIRPEWLRFENLLDLARTPFFEVVDGELTLADPALGPAIDVHTHLALTFLRRRTVDLLAETPAIEHYLPAARAFDMDVYQNKNFSPDDMKRMTHDLSIGSVGCHGMRATHTLPNLAREMKSLGVARSVLLPIDFPVASHNADTWLEASRGRSDFLCFGSVHPFVRDPERVLDRQVAAGARGVKVHPAVQLVPPDHDRCMRIYALCAARRLPVLFHCGPVDIETRLGRRFSQVARYERAIAETPECTFVLGHSGALQMEQALEFSRRYPNVWLEIASQSVSAVRRILDTTNPDRVMYGSDWPFYPQAIGLAKVFLATGEDTTLRRKVLSENAETLFGLR
jgi:predicted TIM-barrel fold metal-dependent hydrolase